MKKFRIVFVVIFLSLIYHFVSYSQLSGIKNIPGDYSSIAAAITDLNWNGVGTGGVTFNISAGHTETASNLTIAITSNLPDISKPIVFQKSGAGINPLITAAAGTSPDLDGIIKLSGTDYITFDGIDLTDPTSNTGDQMMEWGFALLKESGLNGCQNVVIKNCRVTLQKINSKSVGIYAANHTVSSTTSLTITDSAGTNSFNRFFGNSISNVYNGIYLTGSSSASLYDFDNAIGVFGENPNTVTNFGGAGTPSIYGIYCQYQRGVRVFNNIINGGGGNTASVYGILVTTGAGNYEISYNTVTITSNGTSNSIYGVRGLATGDTVIISYNTVQNCSFPTATSALFYALSGPSSGLVNIFNNDIVNNSLAGTGTLCLIEGGTGSGLNVNIYSNKINDNTKTGASGSLYCIQAGSGNINCYSNNAYNNSIPNSSGTSSGNVYGYYNTGSPANEMVYNNAFYNLSVGGTNTSSSSISCGIRSNAASTTVKEIYGNTIYNISNVSNGVYGIYSTAGASTKIYKNNIYDLENTSSSGNTYGIWVSSGTAIEVYNNFISDMRAPVSTVSNGVIGINFTNTSANSSIGTYYNTVYLDASSSGVTFGSSGLSAAASSTATTAKLDLRNNIIVNVSTPGSSSGFTVAYRRSATQLTNFSNESNNNCFYAGVPSPNRLIFHDGTNADMFLSAYKSRVTPRDSVSFSAIPPFANKSTKPYNLHLITTIPTQCESGGKLVSSINDDYDGDLRFGAPGYTGTGTAPDIGADEVEGSPAVSMMYSSGTSTQYPGYLLRNTQNNAIIGIQITMNGALNPLSVTSFTLNTNGTTNAIIDITNAKIYYTGISGEFSPVNQFGTTIASPPAAPTTFEVTGTQMLSEGINYFWIAFDITDLATTNNTVDAEILSMIVGGVTRTPTVTAPSGNRVILGSLSGSYMLSPTQPYPFNSLSNIAFALKTNGVSSPVNISIFPGSGPYNEQIEFLNIPNASSTNTVTINGNGETIKFSSSNSSARAVVKMNGVEYLKLENFTIDARSQLYGWGIQLSNQANNNTITNCTIITADTSSSSSNYCGIAATNSNTTPLSQGNSANNTLITNNTIQGGYHGIAMSGTNSTTPAIGNKILNNTIQDFYYYGINLDDQREAEVIGNDISRPTRSVNGSFMGVHLSDGSRLVRIERNKIHNVSGGNTSATTTSYGIYFWFITAPSAGEENIAANNIIYNFNNSGAAYGIYNNTSNGVHSYYNTIALDYSFSTAGTTVGYYQSGAASNINIRNNIFAITRGGTGFKHCLYFSSATSTIVSNYNSLYMNAPAGTNNIGYHTTSYPTLATWRTANGGIYDQQSIDANPLLGNILPIPQSGSPVLAAGTPIPGITTDFLGITRSVTNPSIGAFEEAADAIAPVLSYTALGNTSSLGNRTLPNVYITDVSGINTLAGTAPRLYFKKSTDLNVFGGNTSSVNGWKWTETSQTTSPFEFIFNYSLLYNPVGGPGSVSVGDEIEYFVAAQDNSPLVNVGANPSFGFSAVSVGNITTPPSTPNQYLVVEGAMTGDYTVGLSLYNLISQKNLTIEKRILDEKETAYLIYQGFEFNGPFLLPITDEHRSLYDLSKDVKGIYPTLTAAVSDAIDRGITGNVRFLLVDSIYTGETYPIIIPEITGMNALRTMTIKPSETIRAKFVGNASPLFLLNGVDYLTFDGSNTTGGTTRDLKFVNTHGSGPIFKFENGSTNNVIKNCALESNNIVSNSAMIWFGTSTSGGNDFNTVTNNIIRDRTDNPTAMAPAVLINNTGSEAYPNSNNTITNNEFANFTTTGVRITSTGTGSNWLISGNSFYNTRPTWVASSDYTVISCVPGLLSTNNFISGNYIGGGAPLTGGNVWTDTISANSFIGILATGGISSSVQIEGNKISNIRLTKTGTRTFTGIRLTGGGAVINGNLIGDTLITNNIRTAGDSPTHGIHIQSKFSTVEVENNIIANVTAEGQGVNARIRGIVLAGDTLGNVTVLKNKILNLSTMGSGSGISSVSSIVSVGIYCFSSTFTNIEVGMNRIAEISALNTGNIGSVVAGIAVSNFTGKLMRNYIYSVKNFSTGTDVNSPPVAAGVIISSSINPAEISNNMISIGDNTNAEYIGIWCAHSSSNPKLYYNSIRLGGISPSGDLPSFGFLRGDNSGTPVTASVYLRNNIFANFRTGSSGKNYSIANQSSVPDPAGWNSAASDFNLLYSLNNSTLGLWGSTDRSFIEWKSSTGGDENSIEADPQFFSSNDLHISLPSSQVSDNGIPIPGVLIDFDGESRSQSTPDIGADEVGTFQQVVIPVDLTSGWNLISNPVIRELNQDSVKLLFPSSINNFAFGYTPGTGYQQRATLSNGVGYWAKFPAAASNPVSGFPIPSYNINVVTGWNMVGSISYPVGVSSIGSYPSGLAASNWFEYNSGYNLATNIIPGKAYWIKANTNGYFVLSQTNKIEKTTTLDLSRYNSITITDNSDHSQTLYFGIEESGNIDFDLYELPPIPPSSIFDVRFEGAEGGYMLVTHPVELPKLALFPVSIQTAAYPITVQWKINSDIYSYELNYGDVQSKQTITNEGRMTINNPDVTRLTLLAKSGGEVPEEFALMQNYPNPFNPVTNIKFALPVPSKVTMEVYNILGQKVRTLINEERAAGYHVIEWNSRNDAGQFTGSGVYYVKISADGGSGNTFTQVRKMVILR